MEWNVGPIYGCEIRDLHTLGDERGWLAEFFRHDELPAPLHPAMGYLSLTHTGAARGPHEHEQQTDLFLFFSGTFRIYLWDPRTDSPTFRNRLTTELGEHDPAVLVIPPGVVHAYRNIGPTDAYIINCPNRLYAGEGKMGPVDEIRHEDVEDTPFVLD